MSRILKGFRNDDDDDFSDEEVSAAELIVESRGKKVVSAAIPGFDDNQCFICRQISADGAIEKFTTNNSSYSLFICNGCRDRFKD